VRSIYYLYIYINFDCLGACLSVCTSKQLNRSDRTFLKQLTWPQGKFLDAKNCKNLSPKNLDFHKILKSTKKYDKIRKHFIVPKSLKLDGANL